MKKEYKISLVVGGIILLALYLGFLSVRVGRLSVGSAPPGLVGLFASTTQISLGTGSTIIFSTTTPCSARIVSTSGSPIMISFGASTTGVRQGHVQGASTTVSYDSGIYGCGQWRAAGFDAATTINLTEIQ